MKLIRTNISSNSPWEDKVGYSRAVKFGSQIYVSGTTATDDSGKIIEPDDAYRQTIQCIQNIENALKNAGSSLNEIVRIRIYVANIDEWEKIGEALNYYFKEIKPAATMVEISRLITPKALVEIEADAIVQ